MEYVLAALLLTLLGVAYVKGYDFVSRRAPDHLAHFCLALTVIRILFVATFAGLVILFKENREETIRFAAIYIIMYAAMMVVTLKLRH